MAFAGLCLFFLLDTLSSSKVTDIKGDLYKFTKACNASDLCASHVDRVKNSEGDKICANLAAYADCLNAVCTTSKELEELTRYFGGMCKDGSAYLYLSTLTLVLSILTYDLLS